MTRRLGHLLLILCLALTGVGLGAARGTVAIAGQLVLCTSDGIVVVYHPDAPGTAKAHICPDMALSLLSATTPDAALLPVRAASSRLVLPWSVAALISRSAPVATARAPPFRLMS